MAACWLNPSAWLPESWEFYRRRANRIVKAVNRDYLFEEMEAVLKAWIAWRDGPEGPESMWEQGAKVVAATRALLAKAAKEQP